MKNVSCLATGAMLLALCFPAAAQQPAKLPRVGYLTGASPSSTTFTDAFRQGLHDLGYVEGQNVAIEYRYAEGNFERLPALAAELVGLKADVIFASSTPAVQAAKKATTTIPIVSISGNPVESGFIASLARPGGNITGLASFAVELAEKRLELLRETFPKVARVAVLWNPDTPLETRPEEMQVMAKRLGMELQLSEVRVPEPDFARAFQAAIKGRVGALAVMQIAFFSANQKPILDFAAKNRMPVIYTEMQKALPIESLSGNSLKSKIEKRWGSLLSASLSRCVVLWPRRSGRRKSPRSVD